MSIAFLLFFFSSETIQKRFKLKNEIYDEHQVIITKHNNILIGILFVYFIFQIGLPIRHWMIKDDVLWTEEGHRMSWRMMLRSKSGTLIVRIEDKKTRENKVYDYKKLLSPKQGRSVATKPDLMWQLAQKIKAIETKKGNDIAIYINSKVSVNGGPYHQFTNPKIDIANLNWDLFKHSNWLLPSPLDYHNK